MNKFVAFSLVAMGLVGAFYMGRWSAPIPQITAHSAPLAAKPLADISQATPTMPLANPEPPSLSADHPSYQRDWLHTQSLLTLAKNAPEAALEQTRQLKGALSGEAQQQILNLWAQTNPQAAWRWLESQQPNNSRGFIALLGGLCSYQPQACLDLADSYAGAHGEMKKDIYLAAIQGLGRGGHYDSASFLIGYLDDKEGIKAELTGALVELWGTYEPQAAAAWLSQQPSYLSSQQVGRLGAVWSASDPAGAVQYAQQLSDDARPQWLNESFGQWAQTDPQAAASWIGTQPSAPPLDPLLNQLALSLAQDPAQLRQALDLSARITEQPLKLNTLLSLLSPIRQADASQALAYIQQLDFLTDAERASLMRDLALNP